MYSHATRSVHDRVQHEIRDEAGAVVEAYPPAYGGYSGQRLRQFVLERVDQLNREANALPPIEDDYVPVRELYERRIYSFSPAERTKVFVSKKCLRCHKLVYEYPHKRYNYCPGCDMLFYVKPKENE